VSSDWFGIALDTFHDGRNGYLFYISMLGGLFDSYLTDERDSNADWNGVLAYRTARFEGGWTVEVALPFKSLRYPSGSSQVWGINLGRGIRHKNEWTFLTPLPARWGTVALRKVSSAATLVDLEAPTRAALPTDTWASP
jgi:hypothetical protein